MFSMNQASRAYLADSPSALDLRGTNLSCTDGTGLAGQSIDIGQRKVD